MERRRIPVSRGRITQIAQEEDHRYSRTLMIRSLT